MKSLALAAALIAPAAQATALDCLPPDPARSWQTASASEDAYAVLLGTLEFDEGRMPPATGFDALSEPDPVPARFTGRSLSASGAFDRALTADLTIRPVCDGAWCGTLAPGEILAFARIEGERIVIEPDPCGTTVFPATDAVISEVTSCQRGGACDPG